MSGCDHVIDVRVNVAEELYMRCACGWTWHVDSDEPVPLARLVAKAGAHVPDTVEAALVALDAATDRYRDALDGRNQ